MKKVYDGFVLTMIALVATAVKDVVVFGGSIGIAQTAGEIGEDITVDTVGVYEFPTVTVDTISVGDIVYWDNATKLITTTADTNTMAGVAWSVKVGGVDTLVDVKIG